MLNPMLSARINLFSSIYFRLGLGLAISALSLFLALRNVNTREVWFALRQAEPGYVLLALGSVALNTFGKTVRWRVLMGKNGSRISTGKYGAVLLIGQMLNTLYPARIGDLSRVYLVGGMGAGRSFTLGTVLVEKLLDLLSYALLFIFLLLLIPMPSWVDNSAYLFTLAVLLVSTGVFILANRPGIFLGIIDRVLIWLPGKMRLYLAGRLQSALFSLGVLQNRTSLISLAFWSALVWGTAIINNHFALMAVGIRLPWTASLLVLIVLQAGISIPSVPGRIGIFEYSCILALSLFGIEQSPALSFGIVLHAVVMIPTTLAGLLFFWLFGWGSARGFLHESGNLSDSSNLVSEPLEQRNPSGDISG